MNRMNFMKNGKTFRRGKGVRSGPADGGKADRKSLDRAKAILMRPVHR